MSSGIEGRRYKEERWGMSAFDKRTGHVSAHSLGRASSALRSERLIDGKQHTEGNCKDALKKGSVLRESGSTIIYMILLPKVQRRKDDAWRRCKTRDIAINVRRRGLYRKM